MFGPGIIARSIQANSLVDAHGNAWQYNSWSDHHSKVACWAVLFDLLLSCDLLRRHASQGSIAFGINHQMADFRADRQKDLDLVVCTPGTGTGNEKKSFADLAAEYPIVLSADEQLRLRGLPALYRAPVGSVHIALEAKATMTAHVKALPRLYDELTSSHLCVHGASNRAIAVGLSLVNAGSEFISPKTNPWRITQRRRRVNVHRLPKDVDRTISKVRQIARRSNVDEKGFDALGLLVVSMRNDGTAVTVVETAPAVSPEDILHYDSMIRRTVQLYEARFPHI